MSHTNCQLIFELKQWEIAASSFITLADFNQTLLIILYFLRAGFPKNKDNLDAPIPRSCHIPGFDSLLEARNQLTIPLSQYSLKQILSTRDLLSNGVPFILDENKLANIHGQNHFDDETDLALCCDSLAASADQNFLIGPFKENTFDTPQRVGVFTREQESSQKKRCITNFAFPKSGGSFNDAQGNQPTRDFPITYPGTIISVFSLIIDAGRGCWITKNDLQSAYKLLPVQIKQRKFQVYKIGKSEFCELSLCFGDNNACHLFTFAHRSLIENFIFPFIKGDQRWLSLVVDDSIYIAPENKPGLAHEYNTRYKLVMETLHFTAKPHDINLRKSFNPSQQGEVLGVWVNTRLLSWTIHDNKISDILRKIDLAVNPHNIQDKLFFTLKTFQRIHGKIADLAKLCPLMKIKSMIIARELAAYEAKLQDENILPESSQKTICSLTHRAKQDMIFIRAMIAKLGTLNLPLIDPRNHIYFSASISVFTDASGDMENQAYLGSLVIHNSMFPDDIAFAYPLPKPFLRMKDRRGLNGNNTILLELLAVLVTVLEFGPAFSNKSVLFTTDSLNLVVVMNNHREPHGFYTNLALQALLEAAYEANIEIRMRFKERNSCPLTSAADALTHANFHLLPTDLLHNVRCRTLPLPDSIHLTLHEASLQVGAGFPLLRDRIRKEWSTRNWNKHLWSV